MELSITIPGVVFLVIALASITGGLVLYRQSRRVGWRAVGMSAAVLGAGVLVVFALTLPVSREGESSEPAIGKVVSTEPTGALTTSRDPASPTSSGMMVPRPQSVEELVARAEVIVLGTITSVLAQKWMGPYGEDGRPLPASDERGLPFTDYEVQVERVLKGYGTIANGGTLVLRMFGHLDNPGAIITPNAFTLPNQDDHLLFALGKNPDGTYGSGPEGLLNVDGERVLYADGVPFAAGVSPDRFVDAVTAAAGSGQGLRSYFAGRTRIQPPELIGGARDLRQNSDGVDYGAGLSSLAAPAQVNEEQTEGRSVGALATR